MRAKKPASGKPAASKAATAKPAAGKTAAAKPAAAGKPGATAKPAPGKTASGKPRKIVGNLILLMISVLSIVIIIKINQSWFNTIDKYWREFGTQISDRDLEKRKIARYGNTYSISKAIADMLKKAGKDSGAVILMPPASYFKEKGLKYEYKPPEPAVFYYFTDMKTVRPDTKDTAAINFYISVANKELGITKIRDKDHLSNVLAEYRKYKITL
jgi:hypothetical protein